MRDAVDFEPSQPSHVALYDELPLWSAYAGALLLEHVPLEARCALDLGCGAGFPMLELAERLGRQARVVGVDPWAEALVRAQAKCRVWGVHNASPVRGDGAGLPFRDGAFGLITSNLGINNFPDPEGTLRECRRVLEPTGTLALTSNIQGHFAQWYAAFAEELESRGDRPALERLRKHVAHRATVDALSSRLAQGGFRVEATHTHSITLRFRESAAVLEHHFMRLGFAAGWREVAGAQAESVLAAVCARLDAAARSAGEVRLTVPLVLMLAKPIGG